MSQDALHQDECDAVDRIVEQWRTERPDLDPSAKGITGRIVRLAGTFQRAYAEAFAPLGISEGDYGILVALRRAGDPYQLTPTDLARARMMTSGGMTAGLDRLERRGLLERRPNPDDRRGSIVALTPEGLTKIDEAMAVHARIEHQLVASLPADQRAELAALLRALLLGTEGVGGS